MFSVWDNSLKNKPDPTKLDDVALRELLANPFKLAEWYPKLCNWALGNFRIDSVGVV